MNLIKNSSEFKSLIKNLEKYNFFTIDTEFLRDKTYFPDFCLMQIATTNNAYIVDVLSPDIDMRLFKDILLNEKIVKVFHSCKQDVEILQKSAGVTPKNIFDTQVASGFCGIGDTMSYYGLCKRLLNVYVDKTQRVTDWSKRPLEKEQLKYALNDVVYLIEVYQKILALLKDQNKSDWAFEYMRKLSEPDYYTVTEEDIWKKISFPQLPAKAKKYSKIMALWREQKAQEANLPRRRFLSDRDLINAGVYLSGINPSNPNESFFNRYGEELKRFVEEFDQRNQHYTYKSNVMNLKQRKLYGLLKGLLNVRAAELQVARHLIAKNDELSKLIFSKEIDDFVCMQGWRYQVFGKDAKVIIQKNQ